MDALTPSFPRPSDCVYHFCEGHDATQHAAFGEAAHIAVTLRMHEESSYEGLDLIECEVRRRTFWLLFGGKRPDFCDCLPRLISPGKLYSHRSCDLARFPTRTYTRARAHASDS